MALSRETVGHCGGDIPVQKAGMLAISLFGRHFDSQVVHKVSAGCAARPATDSPRVIPFLLSAEVMTR